MNQQPLLAYTKEEIEVVRARILEDLVAYSKPHFARYIGTPATTSALNVMWSTLDQWIEQHARDWLWGCTVEVIPGSRTVCITPRWRKLQPETFHRYLPPEHE